MKHLRELRWCLCGWKVYGNEAFRHAELVKHWETEEHMTRMKARVEVFKDSR